MCTILVFLDKETNGKLTKADHISTRQTMRCRYPSRIEPGNSSGVAISR